MKRATRLRLAVASIVLALLALAAWQWQRDLRDAPGTLLSLAPARIERVTLAIGSAPALRYTHRDGHWWVDGTSTRTDDGRLAELAAIAAAPVASWQDIGEFDLAKIGLEPAQVVLTLNGQILQFGEIAVIGPLRYVRVGQRVALVPARYAPRPPTGTIRQAGGR